MILNESEHDRQTYEGGSGDAVLDLFLVLNWLMIFGPQSPRLSTGISHAELTHVAGEFS
jgi:hypothetical protein